MFGLNAHIGDMAGTLSTSATLASERVREAAFESLVYLGVQVSTWIRYGGHLAAVSDDHSIWLASRVEVLERDHPVRRFVSMKCLVAREMQTDPGAELYDDARADFYVRSALIPDDEFDALADRLPDAKRCDRAYLLRVATEDPSSRRLWNREPRHRTERVVSRPWWRSFGRLLPSRSDR
jgi:hypothetical protein